MHACMYVCMYKVHINALYSDAVYVCMSVCGEYVIVGWHVAICMYVCMYVCIYVVHMYASCSGAVYVCMYTHLYVCQSVASM